MAQLTPNAKQQFFTNAGEPAAGYKLYTYAAGTSFGTPQATYADAAGLVPNANPIVLDARGEAVIYLSDNTYDYALKDADDNPVWTRAGINAPRDVLPDLASTDVDKGTSLIGYLTGSLKDFLDSLTSTVGAALIQATPAFSGAIARTLAAFTEDEINSAWFGPDRTGATDASAALQLGLNAAAGKVLVIRPGTYKISAPLKVKSNTTVVAYGCTFNRGAAINNMIRNDADGTTGGYNANSNITILGGTWDAQNASFSGTACTIMAIGHCTGVTIRDATMQNITGYHYIEFNASSRCVAENCVFSGGAEQGSSTMEAIQVDAAIGVGEFPWFGPYDNTPCNGIAVRGCTFNSCGSGVGTHTDPASQHVNITIVNSTFNDTFYACVRGQAWSGVIVANCRLNGGYHGLLFSPAAAFSCNNVALSNNSIENIGNSAYSGTQGRPISLGSVSGKVYAIVSVTGNVVRNCTGSAQYGIYFNATQKLTCLGNEVDNVNSNGVFCDGAQFGSLVGNHVSLSGGSSFAINNSCTEIVGGHNRGATANIGGNSKIIWKDNILGTSQTLGTNTSSLTTPNLVNGASV